MARLLGFQKTQGGVSSEQMLRILEKRFLNQTESGEFTNVGEIDAFLEGLNQLEQTPDVMEKVAELENKKLEFKNQQKDVLNSKAIFEDNLNDALRVEARNNYKDIGALVGSYMNVYADAEEKIDEYINDTVYKRYGTSATPPPELIALKNTIKEKARYYSTMTAMMASPEGMSALNPEGLAVQVQTNPLTGNIISVDVVPRGELPEDYMQTDIKAKVEGGTEIAFPIYVNSQEDASVSVGDTGSVPTKYGRLGSIEFRGVDSLSGSEDFKKDATKELGDDYGVGVLKSQKENTTAFDWLIFGESQVEEDRKEEFNTGLKAARDTGITFKDFNFDGNDIPSGSVVRKGNRLYYQQENGDVSEFEGEDYRQRYDHAQKYLTEIGGDPNKANVPFYADDVYFIAPDGSSRIKEKIGADYFQPQAPAAPAASTVFSPAPQPTPKISQQGVNLDLQSGFFAGRKNQPDKPNTETTTTTASVIEKGKQFFRNRVA